MNPFYTMLIILILVFFAYLCPALFYSQTAEELQIRSPWRAWIPVVNLFLYADILKYGFRKDSHAHILLASAIIAILLAPVIYSPVGPYGMDEAAYIVSIYIDLLAWIIFCVSAWALFYRIFRTRFRNAAVPAILSFIIPGVMSIIMLISYRKGKDSSAGQFTASV